MDHEWLPIQADERDDIVRDLIHAVLAVIHCPHGDEVKLFSLKQWPRVFRVRCGICDRQFFVKSFGRDGDVSQDERRLRLAIETRNLNRLAKEAFSEDPHRIPHVIGSVDAPHFAIIEEYIEEQDFRATINDAIRGKSDDLLRALSALSRLLVALQRKPRESVNEDSVKPIPGIADANTILDEFDQRQQYPELVSHLRFLQSEWNNDDLLKRTPWKCLVHDGLTPVNILYSPENDRIVLTDFETVRMDVPFVDIGTVTAELKLAFALDAHNPYLAEPYIGYFLRKYFDQQRDLHLTYRQFTWIQSYFMGRRLLMVSKGAWLDESLRRWCIETARDVWSVRTSQAKWFSSPFQGKKAVLFDFYNTLVSVRDDEHDLGNFENVRRKIVQLFPGKRLESLPSAAQLRDMYFHEIQKMIEESQEEYPDVDLVLVWGNVLERPEVGIHPFLSYLNDRQKLKQIVKVFRESALRCFEAYPGAVHAIKVLKGHNIMIGIISDAQPAYVVAEIERLGIGDYLDCFLPSAQFRVRKPDARFFKWGLQRLRVSADEVVFVGDDMYRDIYGAKQVGMQTIYKPSEYGCSFYMGCEPDEVLVDFELLPEMFDLRRKDLADR